MKFLLVFLISFSTYASHYDFNEDKYMGYIYQQKNYELDDPLGDQYLLWTIRLTPMRFFKSIKKKEDILVNGKDKIIQSLIEKHGAPNNFIDDVNIVVEGYEDFRKTDPPYPLEGKKTPFKVKNLSNMFFKIITDAYLEEGIIPTYGNPHKWSEANRHKIRKKFPIYSLIPKTFLCLARGVTSYFMVTDQEEALTRYIISKEDNSVTLDQIFKESYFLNQGDIYLSILTIENILSRYWKDSERSKRLITTKLKDITNYNYKTDKFGSWYHLFGIMLYGYLNNGISAKVVGGVETLGSLILSGFASEKQETFINSKGGRVGSKLKTFIKKKQYKSFKSLPHYTDESYYLNQGEDFSKRLKKKGF